MFSDLWIRVATNDHQRGFEKEVYTKLENIKIKIFKVGDNL